MIKDNNTLNAFFTLVSGGLWEKKVSLSQYGEINYNEVFRLASEQAVVGLVAAGLEHVKDVKIPQMVALIFAGSTLQMEQQNHLMNSFIAELVEKMRVADIYTLLVKGQGIAQCYERPLWRACGDVDFFLSEANYHKAKTYLEPLSSNEKPERRFSKELAFNMDQWLVELHGTLRTGLSYGVDSNIDSLQRSVFYESKVRSWLNGETLVFLPAADEDAIFIYTHFLKHFYKGEGVSLRQLCDWCRLLWAYRDDIDLRLLNSRLRKMRLITEWNAFGNVAVKYLGMPYDAMPFFSESNQKKKKCDQIVRMILFEGNQGRFNALCSVIKIFPLSTLRFLPGILFDLNWLKIKERLIKSKSV